MSSASCLEQSARSSVFNRVRDHSAAPARAVQQYTGDLVASLSSSDPSCWTHSMWHVSRWSPTGTIAVCRMYAMHRIPHHAKRICERRIVGSRTWLRRVSVIPVLQSTISRFSARRWLLKCCTAIFKRDFNGRRSVVRKKQVRQFRCGHFRRRAASSSAARA